MRKAMICVTMMLALLQFWPMMFGQKTVTEVASPSASAAVVVAVPKRAAAVGTASAARTIKASASKGAIPLSCYRQYQTAYSKCAAGDKICTTRMADQWDLCEATGFWPE